MGSRGEVGARKRTSRKTGTAPSAVGSAIRLRAVAGPARGLRIAKPQARLQSPPSHPQAACQLALWALGAALTLGAVILRLGDASQSARQSTRPTPLTGAR